MRKSITVLLSFSLICCLSLKLYSQSAENELDQVELMKQFNGKWAAEAGKDTTWVWEITPSNIAHAFTFYLKVKGKTVDTMPGIFGFTNEYKNINAFILYPDGYISRDIGRFVSDNKLTVERFYPDEKTSWGTWECNFLTPNKFTATWKLESGETGEYIYTRIRN